MNLFSFALLRENNGLTGPIPGVEAENPKVYKWKLISWLKIRSEKSTYRRCKKFLYRSNLWEIVWFFEDFGGTGVVFLGKSDL
jgi:hypothetical protein